MCEKSIAEAFIHIASTKTLSSPLPISLSSDKFPKIRMGEQSGLCGIHLADRQTFDFLLVGMLVHNLYEVQFVGYGEENSSLSILKRFQSYVWQTLRSFHALLYLLCCSEIFLPRSPYNPVNHFSFCCIPVKGVLSFSSFPERLCIISMGLTAEMINTGVRYRKTSGSMGRFSYL